MNKFGITHIIYISYTTIPVNKDKSNNLAHITKKTILTTNPEVPATCSPKYIWCKQRLTVPLSIDTFLYNNYQHYF